MALIDQWRQHRLVLWLAVAGMIVGSFVASIAAGVVPSVLNVVLLALPILLCGMLAMGYRRRPDMLKVAICAEAMMLLLVTMAVGGLVTYPAASVGFAYADQLLENADKLIGFDWLAFAHMIDRSSLACRMLEIAYKSIEFQPIVVVFALVWSGHIRRLQQLMLALVLALCITAVGLAYLPAVSAFAHYGVTAQTFANIRPANDDAHVALIAALREGRLHVIGAEALTGMVTFPSFHACAALFFIWAAAPIRILRTLMWPLNAAMLVATPVFGAHYLVDVIAGLVLAIVAIKVADVVLASPKAAVLDLKWADFGRNTGQAALR